VAVLVLVLVGASVYWRLAPAGAAATPAGATAPAKAAVGATPTAAPPTAVPATAIPAPAAPAPAAAPSVPPTATPGPEQRLAAAEAALAAGDVAGSLALLTALEQSDPATPGLDDALARAHTGRGGALLEQGSLDPAYAAFGEALKRRPDHGPALDGQKRVVLAKNWARMEAAWGADDEAAIAALEENLQLDPDFRDTRAKLYALLVGKADRLLAAGDRGGAVPVLTRALEVNPDGAEARQRLAAYTPTPAPPPPPPAPAPAPPPPPPPAPPAPKPGPPPPAPAPKPPPVQAPAPPAPRPPAPAPAPPPQRQTINPSGTP
jgi:hypothetical protein